MASEKFTNVVGDYSGEFYDNQKMDNSWIRARLKEVKKRPRDIAKALDLPSPRVSEILGSRRQIGGDEVVPLARVLDLPATAVLELIAGHDASADAMFARLNTYYDNMSDEARSALAEHARLLDAARKD